MIIYKITNIINNKVYIGQTIRTLDERIKSHLNLNSKCRGIHSALIKYGKDNFTFEVIDTSKSIEELNVLEEKYIKQFNSLSPNGYNLIEGGKNRSPSKETRKIWSKQRTGRKPSEEQKEKQRKALINKPLSNEHKLKISEANKGKIRTKEMKIHQRNVHIGKENVKNQKKIVDQFGTVYNSLKDAANILNLRHNKISLVLNKKQSHTGGYKFYHFKG